MGETSRLAEYVETARWEQFPTDVIEQAKTCVLDNIGCAVGGYQTEIGRMHGDLAKELGGTPESTVLGDGVRVSSVVATYTNATLAQVLDFDDYYWFASCMPGSSVVPSALALAEARGASGKELLAAVVLGYEVALRIGRAMATYRRLDVPHVQVHQAFGSVAACCRLLGLDRETIANALGIMGGMVRGTPRRQRELSARGIAPTIKSNRGMYALQGVLATLQAEKGLTGAPDVLDGDRVWMAAGADGCQHGEMTAGLGEVYRIREVHFKFTPSCGYTRAPMTAVFECFKDWHVAPDEIAEIVIRGTLRLMSYEWNTMLEAQFSIPCALAMSLIGGEPAGPRWYTTGRFLDPDIRALARRIRFEWDPEADRLETEQAQVICTATVTAKDGSTRTARAEYMKGSPENPLTNTELRAKFRANVASALGEERTDRALAILDHLQELDDVSTLTSLLRG